MSFIVLDKDGGKLNLKSGSDEIYLTTFQDTIRRFIYPWGIWYFLTEKGSMGYWDKVMEDGGEDWGTFKYSLIIINGGPYPTYVRMYFEPGRGWSGTLKTEDMRPYDRMNGMLFIDWGENPYDD